MISIIISTYKENNFSGVSKMVEATIGTSYEIIKVENHNKYSLSQAYNFGAEKANFPYLVFMHDDIEIESNNWGQYLIDILKIEDTGIVGFAGSKEKFALPTGFYSGIKGFDFVNVYHEGEKSENFILNEQIEQVKVLDGVFLGMKKTLWKSYQFNESFKRFHFYDLDISLRISDKYKNYVLRNMLLKHNSKGNFNDEWLEQSFIFNRLYFDKLLKPNRIQKIAIRRLWYRHMSKYSINFNNRIRFIYELGIDKNNIFIIFKFLTKQEKIFNYLYKVYSLFKGK